VTLFLPATVEEAGVSGPAGGFAGGPWRGGADSGAGRRAGAGSGYCPRRRESRRILRATVRRHSDDTEAIWSEAPDTAWPGLDSGPFYTFVTIDP
jgi:hypothetical protein